MSNFKLSKRSKAKLITVKEPLQKVIELALKKSSVDFGVVWGKRTQAEQKALFDSGASQTMKSKHLTGDAVDLLAYIGSKHTYNLAEYYKISSAVGKAASELGIKIRWGGCWEEITKDSDTKNRVERYVGRKKLQGKKPFVDAMHFELI